jgi:UDP-glucose 4-epimerase
MNILITGGLGYIGSHIAIDLIKSDHNAILFDNLSNSHINTLYGLEMIVGNKIDFINGNINDKFLLSKIFEKYSIDLVIHCAALKSVSDSFIGSLNYYANNTAGTISLLEAMNYSNVKSLIFSSSATVYGLPDYLPIDEHHYVNPQSPYGRTKSFNEQILMDLTVSDPSWKVISLRYFNPGGAHESGLVGENPCGKPNNLLPYISMVASGSLEKLNVYGGDYLTIDGTGIRDYIHVMDLAEGHVKAIDQLTKGYDVFNLGTGSGCSVLELLHAFEIESNISIPYEIVERRQGDIPACYACPEKAFSVMGWSAKRSIAEICRDTWNWQNKKLTPNQ